MARTWLPVRIELEGGGGIECDPPPVRVLLVGPAHSFAEFADAVNTAFARRDRSHLHLFELSDGRKVGFPDPDFNELDWLDHEKLKVARELKPGDEFSFVFDLGDNWRHRCKVLAEKVDPLEELGVVSDTPLASWGWGWIPDQYGRESADDLGLEE